MKTKVTRWGNSLGIRIPSRVAAGHGIAEGSEIEILEDGIELRLVPAKPKRYSLNELLEGVSEDNAHHELPADRPKGREVW